MSDVPASAPPSRTPPPVVSLAPDVGLPEQRLSSTLPSPAHPPPQSPESIRRSLVGRPAMWARLNSIMCIAALSLVPQGGEAPPFQGAVLVAIFGLILAIAIPPLIPVVLILIGGGFLMGGLLAVGLAAAMVGALSAVLARRFVPLPRPSEPEANARLLAVLIVIFCLITFDSFLYEVVWKLWLRVPVLELLGLK